MKIGLIALTVLLFAAPVFAADVDGKWTGTFAGGPAGDIQIGLKKEPVKK